MPNAPSSMARRTMAVALSRSALLNAPLASPFAHARPVARGDPGEQLVVDRRRREALAEDGGGDALGHHGEGASVTNHEVLVRLGLDVDEAGRHHEALGLDASPAGGVRAP